jgi:hypothetical protein
MQSHLEDAGALQGGTDQTHLGRGLPESARLDEGLVRQLRDLTCARAWEAVRQGVHHQQDEEESLAAQSAQVREQRH